jgi:hypothetical protein
MQQQLPDSTAVYILNDCRDNYMKKTLIAVILFAATISCYSMDERMIREWEASTWRLNILLKSDTVHGCAVQFAIIESEPRHIFNRNYSMFLEKMKKHKTHGNTDSAVNLMIAWDTLFRNVKGDEVYLLLKNEQSGFSSNGPEKEYYLVTRASMIMDQPAAWIIRFHAKKGTRQDIILDDRNAVFLKDVVENCGKGINTQKGHRVH